MAILMKKAVLKKMLEYKRKMKAGEYALQLVELNYSNACNFKCEHCFSKDLTPHDKKMSIETVKRLADQADELGVWQWHLQGGEPTMWDELEEVVKAIDPSRFHLFITSNGWLLDEKKAKFLKEIGVDKVSISIDSMNPAEHDEFRRADGAYDKAIKALFNVRDAGMEANINFCVTGQNVRSQELIDLMEFAKKNSFTMLLVIAAPVGAWCGRHDVLISEEDTAYIRELKAKYPFIHRDLFPLFNFEWGCRTMNGLIYVTPEGDVLSCPFIHIKVGNVCEEPLEEILRRGFSVKFFRDYQDKCLVGEHKEFINRIIPKYAGKKGAITLEEAFDKDDFYQQ